MIVINYVSVGDNLTDFDFIFIVVVINLIYVAFSTLCIFSSGIFAILLKRI